MLQILANFLVEPITAPYKKSLQSGDVPARLAWRKWPTCSIFYWNNFKIFLELAQLNLYRLTSKRTFFQWWSWLWKMTLRSRRIKITEKRVRHPFSKPQMVTHLIQRISKLETIISKLLNINIESLEVTNIECSLPNLSTRMLTLEKMVHDRAQPSQFIEKE